jgi:hypothetical protein
MRRKKMRLPRKPQLTRFQNQSRLRHVITPSARLAIHSRPPTKPYRDDCMGKGENHIVTMDAYSLQSMKFTLESETSSWVDKQEAVMKLCDVFGSLFDQGKDAASVQRACLEKGIFSSVCAIAFPTQ